MPVQIRRAALARVRAASHDDGPADTALCAQRIVSAQVEVRPDSAGVRHGAQAARVRAHTVGDVPVPAGRRRRRRGRLRRQQRRRGRRRAGRRGHTRVVVEITVLLVLGLLLHHDRLPNIVRGGRRHDGGVTVTASVRATRIDAV